MKYSKINVLNVACFLLIVVCLGMQACSSSTDPYTPYTQKNEKIYPDKIDTVIAFSGVDKVRMKIPIPNDPQINKIGLFWYTGTDSLIKKLSSKKDTVEVLVDNLNTFNVTFKLYTYDKEGNRSVAYTKLVELFGTQYINGLRNPSIKLIRKSMMEGATILWDDTEDLPDDYVGVQVKFINNSAANDSLYVPASELDSTVIQNISDNDVRLRSLYYPDMAADTFKTDYTGNQFNVAKTIIEPSGSGSQSDPYRINNLGNLTWITENPSSWDKYFEQEQDIDASKTERQIYNGEKGFKPIGENVAFSGHYDGKNHRISNLFINLPDEDPVGFFGSTGSGVRIKNLHLVDADITGHKHMGGVVGETNSADFVLDNVSITGNIRGSGLGVAGLCGYCDEGGEVIRNSFNAAQIQDASGKYTAGIAAKFDGTMENVYNIGAVIGERTNGGVIGRDYGGSTLTNVYNAGVVKNQGTLDKSENAQFVHTQNDPGTYNNIYFYQRESSMRTTDDQNAIAGEAKTRQEMMEQSTFTGFDFMNTWEIDEDSTFPYLQAYTPSEKPQ